MLCDAHIHFIPQKIGENTSFYKGVWSDREKLWEYLDKNNINYALVVYPSTDAHLKLGRDEVCRIYNECVLELRENDKRLIPLGIIDPGGDIVSQTMFLVREGFKGISIPSSYEGNFIVDELTPLWEIAQDYGLIIFVHPATINPIGYERVKDPLLMPVLEYSMDISMFLGLLMMKGVLNKYNNIKFIFSSLAGVVAFLKERFDRVYQMLRKRELVKNLGELPSVLLRNVYVDTSGNSSKNIIMAMDLFGYKKVLWGSDYPVLGDIRRRIEELEDIEEEVRERIMFKNFLEVVSV